jgi:N4-gp56 family major capsid protein
MSKLLEVAESRLVTAALCDKDVMPHGAGLTAYMVRYKKMSVPLTSLTEGTAPTASTMSLEQVTVTLDQWGDFLEITDVAELTTKHPLMVQAQEVLADNAARVMDREVQLVMLAGTNVQYGDGTITLRSGITSSMKLTDTVLHTKKAQMVRAGVRPWGRKSPGSHAVAAKGNYLGGEKFVLVCGPEVITDIMATSTSLGTFASVSMYANGKALINGEVGEWLGFRVVETNFIPRYTTLGNTTAAVTTTNAFGTNTPIVTFVGSGGSLLDATTYYYKVTRKDKNEGFEEDISIEHTTATTAATSSFTFNFSSLTAGYVYNLYFGASTGDANLKLHTANIEVGTTVTVTAVPASGAAPPTSVTVATVAGVTAVHPVYLLGQGALGWTGFYNAKFFRSSGAQKSDPLDQKRTIGYKFFGKAVIKDSNSLYRVEVASAAG